MNSKINFWVYESDGGQSTYQSIEIDLDTRSIMTKSVVLFYHKSMFLKIDLKHANFKILKFFLWG